MEVSGEPHGKFVLEEVFAIGAFFKKFIILAGGVAEGEIRVGDVLRTPDGKLLVVKGIEKGHKRVDRVVANDRVGIHVEGLGWKPKPNDLKKYSVIKLIDRLRKEIEEKYSHMPKDARQKLVESEVKLRLKEELDKIAFKAYPHT